MTLEDTLAGGEALAGEIAKPADNPWRGRYSTVELVTDLDIIGQAALERLGSYEDVLTKIAPATEADEPPLYCNEYSVALCENPREKADLVQQLLKQKEVLLRESQEVEKMEKEKMLALAPAAQAEQSAKAWQRLDWMYGDALSGALSHNNPFRWRSWTQGTITLPAAVEEFQELAKECALRRRAQRPVIVKIPPGFWHQERRFEDFDSAIAHINRELGQASTLFSNAKEKYEMARQHVVQAQEQVQQARANAEELERVAVAAGM